MKSFLLFFSFFLFISKISAGRNIVGPVCQGYYITNNNEKKNADFIIPNTLDGFLSLQQKIVVVNADGSRAVLYPKDVKLFEITELEFKPHLHSSYCDLGSTLHYTNVKFVSLATSRITKARTRFLYCPEESEFINIFYEFGANKAHNWLLLTGKVYFNNTTQQVLQSGKKRLMAFFADYPLLACLIKSRDLQFKGDRGTMLGEYEKWKLKQKLIAENDTGNRIFNEYLGVRNDTSYVLKACIDADKNYRSRSDFAGSLLLSSATTVIGEIVHAYNTRSNVPDDKKLNFPDPVLRSNPIYKEAYINRAKQIRTDRIVKGALLGTVVFALIVALI